MQDKEDAAIRLQVSTLAPETPHSTPVVVWRPDGSGVWVNGDNGVVRGIEVKTGKVATMLKCHEAGTKVRTLWAGEVASGDNGARREVLLIGGFDKRVFIWTNSIHKHHSIASFRTHAPPKPRTIDPSHHSIASSRTHASSQTPMVSMGLHVDH